MTATKHATLLTGGEIDTHIHIVYAQCNVIIAGSTDDTIIRNMWLAAMGMMDTLIILDVRARIWEEW